MRLGVAAMVVDARMGDVVVLVVVWAQAVQEANQWFGQGIFIHRDGLCSPIHKTFTFRVFAWTCLSKLGLSTTGLPLYARAVKLQSGRE